jgi:hypothetical protein
MNFDLYKDKKLTELVDDINYINFTNLSKESKKEAHILIDLMYKRAQKIKRMIETAKKTINYIRTEMLKYNRIKNWIVE